MALGKIIESIQNKKRVPQKGLFCYPGKIKNPLSLVGRQRESPDAVHAKAMAFRSSSLSGKTGKVRLGKGLLQRNCAIATKLWNAFFQDSYPARYGNWHASRVAVRR